MRQSLPKPTNKKLHQPQLVDDPAQNWIEILLKIFFIAGIAIVGKVLAETLMHDYLRDYTPNDDYSRLEYASIPGGVSGGGIGIYLTKYFPSYVCKFLYLLYEKIKYSQYCRDNSNPSLSSQPGLVVAPQADQKDNMQGRRHIDEEYSQIKLNNSDDEGSGETEKRETTKIRLTPPFDTEKELPEIAVSRKSENWGVIAIKFFWRFFVLNPLDMGCIICPPLAGNLIAAGLAFMYPTLTPQESFKTYCFFMIGLSLLTVRIALHAKSASRDFWKVPVNTDVMLIPEEEEGNNLFISLKKFCY